MLIAFIYLFLFTPSSNMAHSSLVDHMGFFFSQKANHGMSNQRCAADGGSFVD